MVFLKLCTVCIFKSKPTVGKAKIKNLVSFSNLELLVVLAFTSIVSLVMFLQNSVAKEDRLVSPCSLSLFGIIMLISFLVWNKEALEYTKLKLNLFRTYWSFKVEKHTRVHPVVLSSRHPRIIKETADIVELELQEIKTDSGDDLTVPNMCSIQI